MPIDDFEEIFTPGVGKGVRSNTTKEIIGGIAAIIIGIGGVLIWYFFLR